MTTLHICPSRPGSRIVQYGRIFSFVRYGTPFYPGFANADLVKEMDEERYQEVLECCALLPDLAILPQGDLTEV